MKLPELLSKLKFDKGPEKNKLILIALACLLIVYLDFSLIIRLQLKVIKDASGKITKVKKGLTAFARDSAAVEELKCRFPAGGMESGALKVKKAIKDEELPSLLQEISDTANKNNVRIIQVKPSKETKQKDAEIAGGKFSALRLALNLSCGYHSLGRFISQLEDSSRLLAVEEIRIAQGPGDYMLQNVNLALKTYVSPRPSAFSLSARGEFKYDAGGKRNPFIPLVTSDGRLLKLDPEYEDKAALLLEGIIYDKRGLSYAIVNGMVVRTGDTIGDYRVLKIEERKVAFIKEGEVQEVELKEEKE